MSKPMKAFYYFFVLLSALLLISVTSQDVVGQEATTSPQETSGEVEGLRRWADEEKAQIHYLQMALQKETEESAEQQQLLEGLQQKLEQLTNSAAAPANAVMPSESPTSSQAAVAQDHAEAGKPENVPESTAEVKPQEVQAGFGKIKFTGLIQGWFVGGNGGFSDTFRLRRARMRLTGEMTPEAKWTISFDLARTQLLDKKLTRINGNTFIRESRFNPANHILQDAFVTFSHLKRMNISVGQIKPPLGLESLQNSASADTIERALFTTEGDSREIGVLLNGPLNSYVDYQLGLFNGSGDNQDDTDDQKIVVGRLVVRPPFVRGLQLGGGGVWGNGERAGRPRHDRFSADIVFVRGPLTLKSEFMAGKEGERHRQGYYATFGYRFRPKLEGIFRFDFWDPNRRLESNAENVTERDYVTGLNYYIHENNVKLQFNYLRKTFTNGILAPRNLVIVNLQTSW
jgi:phosphate-selective porin